MKKIKKWFKWLVGVVFRTATTPTVNQKRDEVIANDSSPIDKMRGGF